MDICCSSAHTPWINTAPINQSEYHYPYFSGLPCSQSREDLSAEHPHPLWPSFRRGNTGSARIVLSVLSACCVLCPIKFVSERWAVISRCTMDCWVHGPIVWIARPWINLVTASLPGTHAHTRAHRLCCDSDTCILYKSLHSSLGATQQVWMS